MQKRCLIIIYPVLIKHNSQLTNIVQNKDLQTLHRFDGVKGLAKILDTNLEDGIYGHDLNKRRSLFSSNTYEKQPKRGFFYFVANGFSNIYHCMLMGYAILTIFWGIKEDGIQDGWYEGGSILLVVFLVIVANAITASKMRSSVSNIRNNIKVEVVRKGSRQKISIFDLVVGDVVVLNVGDRIPADGLFIDGHYVLVDESSMTGESELKDVNAINNPFLFSGAKVAYGHCRMLVLSVGMNTAWAKVMCSITNDISNEIASLHLYKLIGSIGNVGFEVATIGYLIWFAFLVVMTEYKNYNREHNGKHISVYQALDLIMGIFMLPLIMVAVVIPRGLHQAFHFTLEYSKKRILGDQSMVRKLSVCEAIASATVICTDKTGTLTMNQMSVAKFWLGLEYMEPRSSSIITL